MDILITRGGALHATPEGERLPLLTCLNVTLLNPQFNCDRFYSDKLSVALDPSWVVRGASHVRVTTGRVGVNKGLSLTVGDLSLEGQDWAIHILLFGSRKGILCWGREVGKSRKSRLFLRPSQVSCYLRHWFDKKMMTRCTPHP